MTNINSTKIGSFEILGRMDSGFADILSTEAMNFLEALVKEFRPRLKELLKTREIVQATIDAGQLPDFDPKTQDIRNGDWKILGVPNDLQDRRVEITGPVDRKMVINALNANVKVFMADFEDAQSPTWEGVIQGQINLKDANLKTISFENPENGKSYKLNDKTAMLIARVRGLHLPEKHVLYEGDVIPGGLMDFGLYFFHNHQIRANAGLEGTYYYVPKLQSYQEAAWWDDVFTFTENYFGVKTGTIKATVLIETLPAVFQMDEILFHMKNHIVALNCGRWDYIFSYIKTLRKHADRVLPDRQVVTMDQPFLDSYSRLLIRTCHKRGALAMGGMAALIPAKDPVANEAVLNKVTADKEREAKNGHDGTWVAHPGLADTALAVFDAYIPKGQPNQLSVTRETDAPITAKDLLSPSEGARTEAGMRVNIRVALRYIEAWISGNGCVPIYGLMEDAATAEISRTSIWQWIQHGKTLAEGPVVTKELFRQFLSEEAQVVKQEVGETTWNNGKFDQALVILDKITTDEKLVDFLTLPAYDALA
jgi:malate synthase